MEGAPPVPTPLNHKVDVRLAPAANPLGWRRLWPSVLWLQTLELQDGKGWNWRIWNQRKTQVLAVGAEPYARVGDASKGGVRFGEANREALEKVDGEIEAANVGTHVPS